MTRHRGKARRPGRPGRAAKGGVSGRSRSKKAPILKNHGKRRERAERKTRELLEKTKNTSHRAMVIADGIIRISAQEGVPIQELVEGYLRRIDDTPVMLAIQKRLEFMGRVHEKKGKK